VSPVCLAVEQLLVALSHCSDIILLHYALILYCSLYLCTASYDLQVLRNTWWAYFRILANAYRIILFQ